MKKVDHMSPTPELGHRSRSRLVCIIAVLWMLAGGISAHARPGELDTTFSGDGKVTTDISTNDSGADLAIQSDGKIVVAGHSDLDANSRYYAVARYNTDGSLDTSFDSDGYVTTVMAGDGVLVGAVALQSDGKIIVGGNSGDYGSTSLTVARYTTSGALDSTFDSDGIAITTVGTSHNWIYDLAIQSNGKIVVCGTVWISDYDFVLARYNTDGSLDSSFGSSGIKIIDFGAWDFGYALAMQPDGKVIVGGNTGPQAAPGDFALARLDTDGSLDSSFGSGGLVVTHVTDNSDSIQDIAIQSDGRIVTAGMSAGNQFTLSRYATNGNLDTTFSGDGIATVPGCKEAYGVALQPNGKIVAVGYSGLYPNEDLVIVRYKSGGSRDGLFGVSGVVTIDISGRTDQGRAVALQGDGRIVAAGSGYNSSDSDFLVTRVQGGDPVDITPVNMLLLDN